MRQLFSAIVFLMMIGSSEISGAQCSSGVSFSNLVDIPKLPDTETLNTKVSDTKAAYLKERQVNIKAMRHFLRTYKNISDTRWFKTDEGYIANFLSNGIDTRIVYNDKGAWLYNLLVYSEDKLPFYIRDMVKREYYDDDIIGVSQYESNNKTLYIIRMRNQQSKITTLKVGDGEMEDITRFEKN